jgi:tRNA dimethylallyltransferase
LSIGTATISGWRCGSIAAERTIRAAVILGGPTASGKSALALEIATAFDGVVINADSMQVYRDLPILTAQPTPAARSRVPHRLYGFLDATERCSAGRWAELASGEIAATLDADRLPIVVGGTGLYLRALLAGLAPVPPIPPAIRAAAQQRLAELGKAAFHAELSRRDPAMGGRVRPSDAQRMVRAWEVIEATGRSLADWQSEPDLPLTGAVRPVTLVLAPDRAQLYAACNARFRAMVEHGALAEAERFAALDIDSALPAAKALGLRELIGYVRGETSLETAVAAGQQATRRYAKRQTTWFRHQLPNARWITGVEGGQFSERFLAEIFNFIRNCN